MGTYRSALSQVRFHQGDHRFWLRVQTTQDSARDYLNMRYKLAPSLIAFGRTVQHAGVARGSNLGLEQGKRLAYSARTFGFLWRFSRAL